ncbi:MAG: hypothetical protein ACK5NB_04575 [Flavobacteriaceae bacterium]
MKFPGINTAKNWEENLSMKDVLKMEKQGVDVSGLKERILEREEQKNQSKKFRNTLRFTMEKVDDAYIENKTNLSKLEAIQADVNNPKSQLVKNTIGGEPLLFGKAKWQSNVANAKIIYAAVVQADSQLWEKITSDITPALILYVYSTNPKYAKNISVIKQVSKHLNDFRKMKEIDQNKYSKNMVKLYNDLNDPQSRPHFVLDETILNDLGIEPDADIRIVFDYIYDNTPLPNKRLPSDGIIPFAWFRGLQSVKDGFGYSTRMVPAKYYQ